VTTESTTSNKKQGRQHPISGSLKSRQKYQLAQAEELIQAINHGSSICRGLYLGFLALTAYFLVTISTTNDYNLLVLTPIKLPIFGAEVDLLGFYRYAPWVYFLAHVNLLMTIALLTRKLAIFHSKLSIQPYATRELLRAKLHIFAPIQYLSKQQKGVVSFILWIIVKVLLVLMPPFMLLLIQVDSLAMQDHITVWFQRAALIADMLFAFFLWRHLLRGRARPLAEIRLPGGRPPRTSRERANAVTTAAVYLFILSLSTLGATIPFSPLERATAFSINLPTIAKHSKESYPEGMTVNGWFEPGNCNSDTPDSIQNYSKECQNPIKRLFFDGLILDQRDELINELYGNYKSELCNEALRKIYESNKTDFKVESQNDMESDYCEKLNGENKRKLDEIEGLIKTKEIEINLKRCITPLSTSTWQPLCWFVGTRWLKDLNEQIPASLLISNTVGLDVQKLLRTNQPSNFLFSDDDDNDDSIKDKVVGFNLVNRSFNFANFKGVIMPNIDFSKSTLIAAKFNNSSLQNANFTSSVLNGANFNDAKLQSAILQNARIRGTTFRSAKLYEASFNGSKLYDADLFEADMVLTKFNNTEIIVSEFSKATLYGASFYSSNIIDSDLDKTKFQGANLNSASFVETVLDNTQLQYSNLSSTTFTDSELNGVNLSGADLTATEFKNTPLRVRTLMEENEEGELIKELGSYFGKYDRPLEKIKDILDALDHVIQCEKNELIVTEDIMDFSQLDCPDL